MTKEITPRTMIWMFDPPRVPYPEDGDPGEGDCVIPVAPIMLWATDIEMNSFTANWTASITPETDGYLLSISEEMDFSTFVAGYEDLNVGVNLSHHVIGLERFTTYYMRVTAYDGTCISANSNTIPAQTSGEYVPVALPATNVDYDSFDANWETFGEPVIRYFLDVATDASFTNFVPGFNNLDVGDVTTYNVPGLSDGTPYYYRVRAETSEYLSVDSNTITLTTVIIYTACATFGPDFITPLVSAMFLSADMLDLDSGVIGDYAIDWRLGSTSGAIQFTSGETSDPGEVQAQHPFADEVVFAGTLYPVIKYIYINGIKYTSAYEAGTRYSPDLLSCLSPVVITAVDCTTVLGTDPSYPYHLAYNNVTDFGVDKSRKIKFNLSASTKYFAWDLCGYDVAEQIKIYYCTLLDTDGVLIDNFIHGTQTSPGNYIPLNLNPADYPNNPRTTNRNYGGYSPSLAFITRLDAFTFTAGDYLRIEIIGSVYEPTVTNTNWFVKFKCLTDADMDCTFPYDTGMSKIDSVPSISFAADPTCCYVVTYNTVDSPSISLIPRSSVLATTLLKYNSGFYYWYGPSGGNPAPNGNSYASPVNLGLRWFDQGSNYSYHQSASYGVCMNLAPGQTVTLTKDTNYLVLTFTDVADYNKYVADIDAFHADADYIAWTGYTDADSRYYSFWSTQFKFATSCGDTMTNYYLSFWWGAPITFDPIAKTITIEMLIPVNALVDSACSSVYEAVVNAISSMTTTKNLSLPGGRVSNVRSIGLIYAYTPYIQVFHETQRELAFGISIHEVMLNGICDLSALGFCLNLPNASGYWVLIKYWDRVTLTNPVDHASRLANWRLERKIGTRTDVCSDYEAGDWETIIEVP